jgi:outer membrane protein
VRGIGLRIALFAGSALASACVGTPRVSGVPGASPAPQVAWTPPPEAARKLAPADTAPEAQLPPDLGDRIRRLTLAEIVDIGLRNNASTRLAWANAQAAAAAYGSQRGEWLPTVDGDVSASRIKTVASQGRTAVEQSVLAPSVTLSYLLFDFGGRTGRVEQARQGLLAAGFSHNAAIQDVVLQIQVAYFQYLATRSLLDAQQTTLAEARANLEAAEERRRVGLATIADVLQARTAASQAQLDLQSTEGNLQTTRGGLALALGLPANLPYDVDSTAGGAPVGVLADSVDALIASALRGRPDHRRRAGQPAAVAQSERNRRPDVRHHDPQRRQQLQPLARPDHPDLQRVLAPVRPPGRRIPGPGGLGPERDDPPAGGLPGVQRLLHPADRDPPGGHGGRPDRERTPIE